MEIIQLIQEKKIIYVFKHKATLDVIPFPFLYGENNFFNLNIQSSGDIKEVVQCLLIIFNYLIAYLKFDIYPGLYSKRNMSVPKDNLNSETCPRLKI